MGCNQKNHEAKTAQNLGVPTFSQMCPGRDTWSERLFSSFKTYFFFPVEFWTYFVHVTSILNGNIHSQYHHYILEHNMTKRNLKKKKIHRISERGKLA